MKNKNLLETDVLLYKEVTGAWLNKRLGNEAEIYLDERFNDEETYTIFSDRSIDAKGHNVAQQFITDEVAKEVGFGVGEEWKEELTKEIEKQGFLNDSDMVERIQDYLPKKYAVEYSKVREWLNDNYYSVGVELNGNLTAFFTLEPFETLEEFYNKFNLGE